MKKISSLLIALACLGIVVPIAEAQTIVPANDGTATLVLPDGNRIDITGGTLSGDGRNLFHSFQEFGLTPQQIANFLSNPTIQNILSRVVGGNPSVINGLIQVTGGNSNLFLINPAGIVFGAGASLNVPADFTATTATGISFGGGWLKAIGNNNYQTLIGNPTGYQFATNQPGSIINAGNLGVNPGQNISLIGGTVINTGTINAPGGKITIAAVPGTSRVKLSQEGQLLSIEVELPQDNQGNTIPVQVTSLPELLTASTGETGVEITPQGTVKLSNSETIIPTTPGTTIISGNLNTASNLGGEINITGTQVGLIGAKINASGINGGGTVLIGGDYQGKGNFPNADNTYVSADSVINTDSINSGNGGKVIVWGDKNTQFLGTITARGGVNSGNGGFVEVSGKENLNFDGKVDLKATEGNIGTLLLDPTNITIDNNPSSPTSPIGVDSELPDIFQADFPGIDITINAANLQNQDGNVILEATNNITIANGISLTFVTGGSIRFTADTDNNGAGNFSMGATDSITALGRDVAISGNQVTLGSFTGGSLTTQGTTQLNGNVTTTGNQTYQNAVNLGNNTTLTGTDITFQNTLDGTKDLTVNASGITTFNGAVGNKNALTSLTTNAAGTTQINGNVITTDTQTYNDPIIVTGDRILTGNELDFNQNVSGTGNLTLQPFTASRNIALSSLDNSDKTRLNLTTSDLSNLQNGFNSITIGRTDSSGTITVLDNTTFNDPVTLRSPAGAIIVNQTLQGQDNASITLISSGNTTTLNANIITAGNPITINDNVLLGNNITLTTTDGGKSGANISINGTVNSSDSTARDFTLTAGSGDISLTEAIGKNQPLGNTTFTGNNITLKDLDTHSNSSTGGNISATATGNLSTGNLISGANLDSGSSGKGGNITLKSGGNLTTGSLLSGSTGSQPGGNIQLESSGGFVNINGVIVSGSQLGNGGNVNLKALGNINSGSIITASLGTGTAGNITLTSQQGAITNLATLPPINVGGQTYNISSLDTRSNFGTGGNVSLSAGGDIQVGSINAQGGNLGKGGQVDVLTGLNQNYFRANGTFIDRNNVLSSISTAGGLGGGAITIHHGGQGIIPFIVGNPTLNGTAGAITSGNTTIDMGRFFFTERRGNVAIISVDGAGNVINQTFNAIAPNPLQATLLAPAIPINTLDQVQEILKLIEQATGNIPALVYVSFVPPEIIPNSTLSNEEFARRETSLTAEYENFLTPGSSKTPPTLAIPPTGDYQLELLLLTKDHPPYRILIPEATRDQVTAIAKEFYAQIKNQGRDYKIPAQTLYRWLLAPLEAELKTRKIDNVLFFMPSGLRLIPLAALHDGKEFVAQKPYTIGFAPSINLLDYRYRNLQKSSVSLFGASQFPNQTDSQGKPLGNLLEVPTEAQNIAQTRQTNPFLEEKFTLANLQQNRQTSPSPIVHLATHAEFPDKDPQNNSYIQFYNEKLRLRDWRELNLKNPTVDLLVISACETAVGNDQVELGFGGLAVQSGVKTAIASLWKVSDTGTLALMSEFYRQLETAPTKAQALQGAQQALIAQPEFANPYYWAPFTIIGSPW